MPKFTLLEIVKDILNDMDSDEVNSINDTLESLQVAQIIKSTYYHLISGDEYWPHLKQTMQLTASGDSTRPTHMKMPDDVQKINWIKYNKRKSTDTKDKYEDTLYKDTKDFLDMLNQRDSSSATITSVTDFGGVTLFIKNNAGPSFWTSFDDEYIVFDSYDNTVDTTLQQAKTQVEGYREPTWSSIDSFVPDLPSKAFIYLLEESKSAAMFKLRHVTDGKAEQRSTVQRRRLSLGKWRSKNSVDFPNYGRKK